jgi:hypothetical protein
MYVISKSTSSSSTEQQPSLPSSRRTLLTFVGSIKRSVLSGQQHQHEDDERNTRSTTAYCDLLSIAKDDSNIFFVDSSSVFGLDLDMLRNQDPDTPSQGINHDHHGRATVGTTTTTSTTRDDETIACSVKVKTSLQWI